MLAESVSEFLCSKCNLLVLDDAIECSLCKQWSHRVCAKLSKKELRLKSENVYWYCNNCTCMFPFSNVIDDEFLCINSEFDISDSLVNYTTHLKT